MTDRFEEIEQIENGTISDKVIEIRSVYKDGKQTIQPAWDDKTGWWAGVERLSDEQKKQREYYVNVGLTKDDARHNTKVVLKHGLTLDLTNEVDKTNWAWMKHSPVMAMSFAEAQSSKALWYVHIEGREAELSVGLKERKFKAMEYIMNDPVVNYANRALLLNFDMTGENPSVIKDFLLDVAEKTPDKILHIYRDKSMRINLLYAKAKQKGIITENPHDGVVKYGVTILGVSPESAIAYLINNEDLLELLERDVKPEYFAEKKAEAVLEESKASKTEDPTTPLTPLQMAAAARKNK